jgi:hypothetical protein
MVPMDNRTQKKPEQLSNLKGLHKKRRNDKKSTRSRPDEEAEGSKKRESTKQKSRL